MYPLKEQSSILQKLKAIFSSTKIKAMENIFGNIELIPVEANFYQSNSIKKQIQNLKSKECKPSTFRHTFDYQQSKRRVECVKQIQQLKINIKQTQQKNQQLYNTLVSFTPDFAYVLFQPKNYQNKNYNVVQDAILLQQKLLSELDKLYEENCLLQKHLNRVKFNEQTQQKQKEQNFSQKINHFQFLRNVWHQKQEPKDMYQQDQKETNKCQDFIQRLNKKVAMVRFSINHILKEQQANEINHLFKNQIQHNFVIKSNQYQNLLRLYEQTSMELEEKKCREFYLANKNQDKEVQDTSNEQNKCLKTQIENLTEKIRILQLQAYDSQKTITQLRQKVVLKDKQLSQFKTQQKLLKYVFYSKLQNKNLFLSQNSNIENEVSKIKVYDRSRILDQRNIQNVEHYKINLQITQLIQKLKKQGQLSESNEIQSPSIGLDLQKILSSRNEKHMSLRKSLNDVDMNKIKTDRLSLIKKTNKLTESLSGSNTLRRNISRQRQLRGSKTNIFNKENHTDEKPLISFYKEQSIDFPSQSISIRLQNDLKTKFVRTSNRGRKENCR